MHGGLSPYMTSFDQLRQIQLPFETPDEYCLVNDFLWADPEPTINGTSKVTIICESFLKYQQFCFRLGFQVSRRGISFIFGADVVRGFCNYFKIDMICRAHQVNILFI